MKPSNYKPTEPCKSNYTLLAVGLILLVFPIVMFVIDPAFIIIQYMTRISEGSLLFNLMQERLPGAYLCVYIFNVTNSKAFLAGDDHKLKVEEVGPFTYQEFRTNKDFKLDEDEGVMSYYPFTTAEFQPNESIGDPRTVNVTVPNIAMLGGASMLNSYSLFVKSGFNLLAAQFKLQSLISLDLHSFLWGYKDPLITLGNTLIPGWITFRTLGILDRLYDPATVPRLEVVSADKDKFSIKTMDGCPGLKAWQYDNPSKRTRCNSFIDAYEGMAFPLGLTPERPIRIYRNILCRILELEFVGTRALDYNPRAFVYKFKNNTFSANLDTECLCGDNGCVDGVSNMSPCLYGFSIGLSKAHFLHGDPKMYERIDGMRPDEKKHGSEFVVDPTIGIVLDVSFTLQVNVIVKDVSFNNATRPFANMVVPLCYIKVVMVVIIIFLSCLLITAVVVLPPLLRYKSHIKYFQVLPKISDEITNKLRLLHFVVPYVICGIEILIFLIALIMIVKATKFFLWRLLFYKKISIQISISKPINNICSETPLMEKKRQHLEVVKYQLNTDVS